MDTRPYISFVVVARNDNYGGDFLHRIDVFVKVLLTLCEKHKLPSELIIVEWNPPQDRARLKDAISWPDIKRKYCQVKIIEVPNEIHKKLPNPALMPLFEYIGKNVGVRRSRGEYVLVTNPDVLFSEGLMKLLARNNLISGCYYRTARYDVSSPVPEVAIEEQLIYCKKNTIKKNGYWYSPEWKFTKRFNLYRLLRAAAGYIKWQIWNRSFVNPYVNASGDFFLMHRNQWQELRGYPELKTHSFIDSYLTYMAHSNGYKLKILWGKDVFLFHQEHSRSEHSKRPLTDIEEYHRNCKQMIRQRKPIIFNGEGWGIGEVDLPEYEL